MGIRWLKMGRMSDKMRPDGGQMRKMKDISSVLAPSGSYGGEKAANSPASQGPGEGMGRGKPSPWIGGDWFIRKRSSQAIYTL